MAEGTELHRLPRRWTRTTPAFPVDQTVRADIPEPVEGEPYYRVTGEVLGRLLREAGWKPEHDQESEGRES